MTRGTRTEKNELQLKHSKYDDNERMSTRISKN